MTPVTKRKKLIEVIKNKVETGQEIPSKKQLLIEAGYSAKTAINPADVFDRKGFQKQLEEVIPDALLLLKHQELLASKELKRRFFEDSFTDKEINDTITQLGGKVQKIIRNYRGNKESVCYYLINKAQVVTTALDMGYKLKGKYAPEKQIIYDVNSILKEIQSTENDPLVKVESQQTNDK
jgi:hypothetical protein